MAVSISTGLPPKSPPHSGGRPGLSTITRAVGSVRANEYHAFESSNMVVTASAPFNHLAAR